VRQRLASCGFASLNVELLDTVGLEVIFFSRLIRRLSNALRVLVQLGGHAGSLDAINGRFRAIPSRKACTG